MGAKENVRNPNCLFFPASEGRTTKSLGENKKVFAREMRADRGSTRFESTRSPACSIWAVVYSERGKKREEKTKRPPYGSAGGGKLALSAVVLDPVKACAALTIITSYIYS